MTLGSEYLGQQKYIKVKETDNSSIGDISRLVELFNIAKDNEKTRLQELAKKKKRIKEMKKIEKGGKNKNKKN